MTELRALNRAMFWRILRRLLGANRGRLFVMLLALGSGAAVTAALLNLQVDAKRRLTTEFRAFGANLIVSPRDGAGTGSVPQTLPEDIGERLPAAAGNSSVYFAPYLYAIADVSAGNTSPAKAVIVGTTGTGIMSSVAPSWKLDPPSVPWKERDCPVGIELSSKLGLSPQSTLHVAVGEKSIDCRASQTVSSGGAEDNEVFLDLGLLQQLASLPGRVSLFQVSAPGKPGEVAGLVKDLQAQIPEAEVRPVRQFTEGEAKIFNRISGLLTATVGIVLLLTVLSVMAAMTNVAIERKMDVGLMKAIGGATRRVVRLFLAEAALLGLAGGLMGAAAGLGLSIGLGKAVFGVAARPRLIVYPVAVGLTMLVAIVSALPLRRLASIRPASVFRGEA
jgi:putative ABC transport system permease protein